MHLYRSNRAERLAEALADVVQRPLADAFAAEHIVVQSRGMERWLAMTLSTRLGVWANAKFPFPRHFVEAAFDAALGDPAELTAPWNAETLVWSIASLLPSRLGEPAFAPLASYLRDDRDGTLRMQLAARLARAIDDYTVYRPELVLGWQRGAEPNDFQAELLRALVARYGAGHQAARAERFFAACSTQRERFAGLPERVCLFGIAALPPLYVSVLSALAQHVETHVFVLTPSQEYFADIRRPRAGNDGELAREEGHPLLATLGRLGRDFQAVIAERADRIESEHDLFDDPGTGTLLHTLQSDMLALRERDEPSQALELHPQDDSIQIHSCHGPMREVEVLHDQLARLLADCSLEPHEIVVMTPDIEAYAPVIEAVFGQRSGRPSIPYCVAQRNVRPESRVLDALFAAIEALSGRVTAGAVLDLLMREAVREHLELAADEVEVLCGWAEQAGIRYGIDAAHREELGQPPVDEHTFRFGIERMLLGVVMEGAGRRLYGGRMPLDATQGGSAELAGTFAGFCERLFARRVTLATSHTLAEWGAALDALLDDLVGRGPDVAEERSGIRESLADVAERASKAGFEEPIALASLRPHLESMLDARAPSRGFLSRGVTFCQLVPMRSIPFKVVCLIGMGDERFPSRTPLQGFDRIQQAPRVGDRVPRDDDRHVFLEALLCAREHLILSYAGQSAHDNRVQPPAVVVGDLLDAIARSFVLPPAAPESRIERRVAIERRLVTQHRLHAFSPHYFGRGASPAFFSYASHYCEGARALGQPADETPFLRGMLAPEPIEELSVRDLERWLTEPLKMLVTRELRVQLGADLAEIRDREPLELDPLERWTLGTELMEWSLAGVAEAELLELARARGFLPSGGPGALTLDDQRKTLRTFLAAAGVYRVGAPPAPVPVDLEVGGLRIVGALREVWPRTQLTLSYSRVGGRFETAAFVRHVLGCALRERGMRTLPERSTVIARGEKRGTVGRVTFAPLPDPSAVLARYVELVRRAREGALALSHDASRAYAECLAKSPDDVPKAVSVAAQKLEKFPDPYVKLVYPSFNDFDRDAFAQAACALFEPLLAHRDEVQA